MKNFGTIKETFNDILTESIILKNENGKKLFNKYLKTLKENKELRKQYLIYKNLSSKSFDNGNEAKDYIKENINLLKDLNVKLVNEGIKKLESLLGENKINDNNVSLYEHIDILFTTKKTPSSLDKISDSINFIKEDMLNREEVIIEETETIGLPPSVFTKMMTNKFNSKYSDINESEKTILKVVLNCTEEDKEDLYNELKTECITSIDNKLNENIDLDLKDKILRVKDRLLKMSFNKEEYVKDIGKVVELKNSIETE